MDQRNIKRRDVLPYNEFIKARDTAMHAVMSKEGVNPDPGAHAIQGEGLYSRNDANPYKAMGIPHDEKTANINNTVNANSTAVQDKEHDGEDPTGDDAKSKTVTNVATAKTAVGPEFKKKD